MIQVIFCSSILSAPGRAGAFSRDFTTIFAPKCRAFSGALKIEKLKAPLIPGPWIQMTGALQENGLPTCLHFCTCCFGHFGSKEDFPIMWFILKTWVKPIL